MFLFGTSFPACACWFSFAACGAVVLVPVKPKGQVSCHVSNQDEDGC